MSESNPLPADNDPERYRPALARDFALIPQTVRRTFSFSGRARRTEYGMYTLIAAWIVGFFEAFLVWALRSVDLQFGPFLTFIYAIPIPALIVRRLHDMNLSGWFAVPVFILASISFAENRAQDRMSPLHPSWPDPFGFAGDVVSFFGVILLFLLLLLPGRGDPNRYGPDPRLS